AGTAAVLVGCHHHTVGIIVQRTVQGLEARRQHTIVVGNENTHQVSLSSPPPGSSSSSTSSCSTAVAKQPEGRVNSISRISADTAAVLVGCHHHTVGIIVQRTVQGLEARRQHTIVVGNENTHQVSLSSPPPGSSSSSTSSCSTAVAKQPVGRVNSISRISA